MKKNDTMGYVAYAMMLAIALIVAFVVMRPLIGGLTTTDLPMNSYLYVFLDCHRVDYSTPYLLS
jgi:hypothetical protein